MRPGRLEFLFECGLLFLFAPFFYGKGLVVFLLVLLIVLVGIEQFLNGLNLVVENRLLCFERFLVLLLLGEYGADEHDDLGDGDFTILDHFLGGLQAGSMLAVVVADGFSDILQGTLAHILNFAIERIGVFLKSLLEGEVSVCLENAAEDFGAFLGLGKQEFAELSLGNHRYLGVLREVDAKYLDEPGIDVLHNGNGRLVANLQGCLCLLCGEACAAGLGPFLLGRAPDQVLAAAIFELKLDEGGHIGIGIGGAEHAVAATAAAGLSEQGIGDGVEDGGLAGSGIAGDEEQSLCAEFVEVDLGFARIGAEG